MRQSQKATKQSLRRKTNNREIKEMDTEFYLQLSTQYTFGSIDRKNTGILDLVGNCAYQIPYFFPSGIKTQTSFSKYFFR